MPFTSLGLSEPICRALIDLGYSEPTAIQMQAIPAVLQGDDVIATAQTGTGKTASFTLPLLERFQGKAPLRGKRVRCLILSPTRELAEQLHRNVKQYAANCRQNSMAMYGGTDPEPQRKALIEGIDFLVATPGRLLDMMHQRAVHFDELEALVIDEADKMLDMGFIADINKIIERLPEHRQSLLFSATLPREVRQLAKAALAHPVEILVNKEAAGQPKIEQWLVTVDKDTKSALLSHLIKERNWQQGLIFIETKHGAAKLAGQLEKRGIQAEAFHSGKSQASRERVLEQFKSGDLPFLIATGIAARGLDIESLARVINYDLPYDCDEFVHRIGRTGRAGAKGEAISLVSRDDFKNLCAIESHIGHLIERREEEGFEPRKEVPVSILNYKPKNQPAKKSRDQRQKTSKHQGSASNSKQSSVYKQPQNAKRRESGEITKKRSDKPFNPWLK